MKHRARSILVAAITACAALQGCATPVRLKAVPAGATVKAEIPGMPGVRYVLPDDLPAVFRDAQESLAAELKARARTEAGTAAARQLPGRVGWRR
jgi:hypothetical protein